MHRAVRLVVDMDYTVKAGQENRPSNSQWIMKLKAGITTEIEPYIIPDKPVIQNYN
jgi:hypothetical protein